MDVANFKEVWAPGGPGSALKYAYTASASIALQIRAALSAGAFAIQQAPLYISMRVTGGALAHVVFGDANVGAPTDADWPISSSDGWQHIIIPANVTHFRIKDTAAGSGGDVYVWLSGRQG